MSAISTNPIVTTQQQAAASSASSSPSIAPSFFWKSIIQNSEAPQVRHFCLHFADAEKQKSFHIFQSTIQNLSSISRKEIRDLQIIEAIETLLQTHSYSEEDVSKLTELLSHDTLQILCEALYLNDHCPSKEQYAISTINKTPLCLLKPCPPFIYFRGENILSQMKVRLLHAISPELIQNPVIKMLDALEESILSGKSNEEKLTFFSQLPLDIQHQFFGLVYELSSDRQDIFGWGEKKVLGDINCLLRMKSSVLSGRHLIDQVRILHKDRPSPEHLAELKMQFLNLYKSEKLGHFELKKYFKNLPESLQKDHEIPKPPYYGKGVQSHLYQTFGSHYQPEGTTFRVHAPNAKSVTLHIINPESHSTEKVIPLIGIEGGIWENIAQVKVGTNYVYMIEGKDGITRCKADPYAKESRLVVFDVFRGEDGRKQQYSVVCDTSFEWTDQEFIKQRAEKADPDAPASIYEVHVSSWKKRADGSNLNWVELGHELAKYCTTMRFSHVELMGVLQHPSIKSWGYQPSGFFSPDSRMGSLKQFKQFINYMHNSGIKVIIDWVPGHFAVDDFNLKHFDGTALFEHADERRAIQDEWGVTTFDFEKKSIRDFLLSSANYWIEELHIDGIRVDAVTSILHTDHGRKKDVYGQPIFLPHHKGKVGFSGHINSDAKLFLRDLNTLIHQRHKGVTTYAEESSGFPLTTKSIEHKDLTHNFSTRGLGFDAKWAMGRMTHSLSYYFRAPKAHRNFQNMIHGLNIDSSERVVDVISHDESANGKRSLRSGMRGSDYKEDFAQTRLYLSRGFCSPGAKLMMMGCEIGQEEEWSGILMQSITFPLFARASMDWKALTYERWGSFFWPAPNLARCTQTMVQDLNTLYFLHPALHSSNYAGEFQWAGEQNHNDHVLSYHRTSKDQKQRFLCVHNLKGVRFEKYDIDLTSHNASEAIGFNVGSVREVFNSDDKKYGGDHRINSQETLSLIKDDQGRANKIQLQIAPYSTIIIEEKLS
jgi:1,4-alpha-glucan branching enzyme